jgi:hypothetical protein
MNRHPRPEVVPAVLVTLGLLLTGCTDSSDPEAGGTPTSAASSAPTSSDPSESQAAHDYTVIDPEFYSVLDAGRYALAPIGPNAGPLAVVDVPDGYISSGPFLFPAGKGTHEHAACCSVGYWTVAGVYKNPCDISHGWPKLGPSVNDMVRALAAQPLTTTTKPTPVTVGGYDGVYLKRTMAPGDLDVRTCTGKSIAYWESDPGTRYLSADESGVVDRLWILNVDGERVVLDAAVAPGVDKKRIPELVAIVESAHFVEA